MREIPEQAMKNFVQDGILDIKNGWGESTRDMDYLCDIEKNDRAYPLSPTTRRVIAAAINTMIKLPGYLEKTAASRTLGADESMGSQCDYIGKPEGLIRELFTGGIEWTKTNNENVAPGCSVYTTLYPGKIGVVSLDSLAADTAVTIVDPKQTGCLKVVANGIPCKRTNILTAIIGPEDDKDVIYTFHPGPPVRLDNVEYKRELVGRKTTIAEARVLGFTTANLTPRAWCHEQILRRLIVKEKANDLLATISDKFDTGRIYTEDVTAHRSQTTNQWEVVIQCHGTDQ